MTSGGNIFKRRQLSFPELVGATIGAMLGWMLQAICMGVGFVIALTLTSGWLRGVCQVVFQSLCATN